MSFRDPRADPQPGDVLRLGVKYAHRYFEVLDKDPRLGETCVSCFDVSLGREHSVSKNQWREWMRGAEVLTNAS
jgi:hypothetical protein